MTNTESHNLSTQAKFTVPECKLNNLGWLKPVLPTAARKYEGGTHGQCLNFPLLISLVCQQQPHYATGTPRRRQNTSGQQLLYFWKSCYLSTIVPGTSCGWSFMEATQPRIYPSTCRHTDRDSPRNWHLQNAMCCSRKQYHVKHNRTVWFPCMHSTILISHIVAWLPLTVASLLDHHSCLTH